MKYTVNTALRSTWIVCAFLCLALAGCETQPARETATEKIGTEVDEGMENNARQEVPAAVSSALVPSISLGATDLPELKDEQHFDIAVNDVPAQQFFMSLVDGTRYNMVVHPEVSGSITLNLGNVTIPEVLEAVRDVYGYEFVATEYGFQVLPGRLQARIYQINYLNVERSGRSQTVVSSGSLTSLSDDAGSSRTSGGGGDGTATEPTSTILGTVIRTNQPESLFWQQLADSVAAIVGAGEGRSVVVNPQSGVVVVRALPTELREVEAYLEATQLIVQRQVILEAKILEVRLKDGFQSGINWSMLLTPGNDRIRVSNLGGGTILTDEAGASDIAGSSGSLDESQFPFAGTLTSAFGGAFTVALAVGDFTAFIELLETQGSVQVLSSPRVA
ncbi:MAG: secretin N-terminal domain-containing protein, partial [Gammaproteobacteria bacterium]|nr:secretin N-terminal domain-containing protein [Gammaproteobacteria bacterium]